MPFRVDIISPQGGKHIAPTQAYQDYLDDVEKYGDIYEAFEGEKYTQVGLVLSVNRESINWSIVAPLDIDYSSQKWRNEVYGTAADAQRATTIGCVGYYRGTNSLHVKRQHQTIEEAAHNHNHYRFDTEVTPDLFAQHLRNFIKFDERSTHNDSSQIGEPKFLSEKDAELIIQAFTLSYEADHKDIPGSDNVYQQLQTDSYYQYTPEDLEELEDGKKIEGECRDFTKSKEHTMAGLRADRAGLREHTRTSPQVIEARTVFQTREKDLKEIRVTRASIGETYLISKASFFHNEQVVSDDFQNEIDNLHNAEEDSNVELPLVVHPADNIDSDTVDIETPLIKVNI